MSEQDRLVGTLLGMASRDALGAGYEFDDPPPRGEVAMIGGGLGDFAPGEWTDDTSMAVCIAEVTATGTIDRAIGQDRLDGVRDGVAYLPEPRRQFWSDALTEAEQRSPCSFTPNGFTVTALQAVYAVIVQTPIPETEPAQHLEEALIEAVRIGDDTDTVAAIAGMVLGARWGAAAVPPAWRDMLHGWPGLRAADLERLAILTANGDRATDA